MKNHGLRRVFSLFLALFMVFTLLPTAAFAEDATEPKAVVVEDDKQEPKQEEVKQPEGETPEEPKDEVKQPEGEKSEAPADGNNDVAPLKLDTGHTLKVRFTILYVSDEFRVGYNYGTSESTTFVCQYSQPHSDTAYTNHTIKISDIKAAAGRASVTGNYSLVGWAKKASANPQTWGFDLSGTTACNGGDTIYLVAKLKEGGGDAKYRWNFTLRYDANGGTGAPAEQFYGTQAAREKTHDFVIRDGKPTREGYIFKGWSETKDGSAAYQPGGIITVSQTANGYDGGNVIKTLYAVWGKAESPKPDKPHTPTGEDLGKLGNTFVVVKCISNDAHAEGMYVAIPGSCSFTEPELSAGKYTSTVTVTAEPYVNAYSHTNGTHTLDDEPTKSITLTWNNESKVWTAAEGAIPIVFNVKCKTEAPAEDITISVYLHIIGTDLSTKRFIGTDTAKRGETYTIPSLNKFTTIKVGAIMSVTGNWDNKGFSMYPSQPVVWNPDSNEGEMIYHINGYWPGRPTDEDLAKLEAPVEVVCTTKPNEHAAATLGLRKGTYTIGQVTGNDANGYFCDISVTADEYVALYNTDFGKHTLPGDNTKTLRLKFVDGEWFADEAVTFNVECVEELFPVKLVIYRNGDTSKAYTTVSLESQPKGHVIDLTTLNIGDYYTANYTGKYDFYGWYNDGTWNVYKKNLANPPAGLEKITVNGWTNIIGMVYDYEKVVYFQSAEALKAYQGDHSKTDGILYSTTARKGDTLPTADAPTATRTGYTFKFWSREGQSGDVTGQAVNGWTNLYANWEKNVYTVTYTDGVNGKAFADQVYNVPFEDATPAFEGTPTRKGFVFDGWTPEVAATVTDNAIYTAQWKPVQPDKKAIEGAIGRGVAVVCDNQNVNHGEKKYKPTLGEYTVSDVMGTAADGYTCTVTVKAAKFIEKYSSDMGDAVHTLIAGEPAEKAIELKWNGEEWVSETELPVTFHTLCPPEQPSKKDIEGAIGRGVKIVCDNQNVNHWGKDYKPTQGEYTVSDVTGTASEGYTCTITVKAAKIVEKYGSDFGKTHDLIVGEAVEKSVELKWDGEKWVAKTELPITFHVECPPEKPTYDDLSKLGIDAKVDCTTTTAHTDTTYALIEGTYEISDPARKGTAYTCILTVNAKDYVAKYNAEENVGPHTLDDRDSKTIELTWNGEKWTAAETSVTFNVKCELYTVTYTDGVKGEEVFEDVVYKDIPYGTDTPAFGTKAPTREGYKFAGWEPEVTETVTKDVTYTAKWEKLYTVTYTDGVKGKAFKDQVYKDLESGTATPKFNGTPKRSGYTFTGWSPKVTDTVTKDVTYVAQWKSVKNGKDNIPKTGDSEIVMVLGSVLLFSFCGATAVCVCDRKRRQG